MTGFIIYLLNVSTPLFRKSWKHTRPNNRLEIGRMYILIMYLSKFISRVSIYSLITDPMVDQLRAMHERVKPRKTRLDSLRKWVLHDRTYMSGGLGVIWVYMRGRNDMCELEMGHQLCVE